MKVEVTQSLHIVEGSDEMAHPIMWNNKLAGWYFPDSQQVTIKMDFADEMMSMIKAIAQSHGPLAATRALRNVVFIP